MNEADAFAELANEEWEKARQIKVELDNAKFTFKPLPTNNEETARAGYKKAWKEYKRSIALPPSVPSLPPIRQFDGVYHESTTFLSRCKMGRCHQARADHILDIAWAFPRKDYKVSESFGFGAGLFQVLHQRDLH